MLLPLLWGLLLSPIAIFDVRHGQGRASFDQILFHEHTIKAMVDTWPIAHLISPEQSLPDHFVAMTPGYHWVLAGVLRFSGVGDPGLRLVGLGLSVAVMAAFGWLLGRKCGPVAGALLVAPLMASVYVANSAAWLLADNVGWFWVAMLSLAALWLRPTARWAVLMGGLLLLTVWTRQNLLYLALPLWAAAWLRPEPEGVAGANPLAAVPARMKHLAPMALATLPAIASVAYLYSLWGGLVPYEFQGQYDGANPSNVPLQFMTLAAMSVFFVPAILGVGETGWRKALVDLLRRCWVWMLAAALASAIVAAAIPTTYAPTDGRAGLVWSITAKLSPVGYIGHTSPIVVLLAGLGAAMLTLMLTATPARQRWILGAVFAGFGIAQAASSEVWQRYHEPFALLFLAVMTGVAIHARRGGVRGTPSYQLTPIAALAIGLAIVTTVLLWRREIGPWLQGESPVPVSSLRPPLPEYERRTPWEEAP